jgi:hypothetical protein
MIKSKLMITEFWEVKASYEFLGAKTQLLTHQTCFSLSTVLFSRNTVPRWFTLLLDDFAIVVALSVLSIMNSVYAMFGCS